jgi:hypothetical protein
MHHSELRLGNGRPHGELGHVCEAPPHLPTNMMFEASGLARLFSIRSSSLSALPSSDLQIHGHDARLSRDVPSSGRVTDSFSGTELRGRVIQPEPEGARILFTPVDVGAEQRMGVAMTRRATSTAGDVDEHVKRMRSAPASAARVANVTTRRVIEGDDP